MSEAINNIALIIIVMGQILTYFWFITLGLIALCFILLYDRKLTIQTSSHKILQFIPFLITLVILVCGGVFYGNNSLDLFYPHADLIIYALLFLQFIISAITIFQTRGQRGFMIALSVLQLWLSSVSGFVSLMSVRNAWL